MNGRRKARGFTLIELLVTIAVIAIAVGIGVPAWSTFTQESSVSGATSELVGAINDARSMAVAQRTNIEVRAIGGDWNRGLEIYRLNVLADPDDDDLLFTLARTDLRASVVEDSDETNIRFDRSGRLTAARGFDVGIKGTPSGAPARRLDISPFGRVQVTKP